MPVSLYTFLLLCISILFKPSKQHFNYPSTESNQSSLPLCVKVRENPNLKKHREIISTPLDSIDSTHFKNGFWLPDDCTPRAKLAILFAYRNREKNLLITLPNLISILQKQRFGFKIFIIEQTQDTIFNRGKLLNVGYEVQKNDEVNFDCLIFHDIDMILVDERLSYGCDKVTPIHLASKRWTFDSDGNEIPLGQSFGAVSAINPAIFTRVNGYSNLYWGWGGEDDDLLKRLKIKRLGLSPIGRSTDSKYNWNMVDHGNTREGEGNPVNFERFQLRKTAKERYKSDGLNTLDFEILEFYSEPLFQRVLVDVGVNSTHPEPTYKSKSQIKMNKL